MKFDAPNKVSLYLLGTNYFVVENFNDEKVDVTLDLPVVSEVNKVLTTAGGRESGARRE